MQSQILKQETFRGGARAGKAGRRSRDVISLKHPSILSVQHKYYLDCAVSWGVTILGIEAREKMFKGELAMCFGLRENVSILCRRFGETSARVNDE